MIRVYYSKDLYEEALMYVRDTDIFIDEWNWSDESCTEAWQYDVPPKVKDLKEYVIIFEMIE